MTENQDREDRLGQLADEFAARIRGGEDPKVSEYVARYPEHAEEIRSAFPGILAMEGLKHRRQEKLAHSGGRRAASCVDGSLLARNSYLPRLPKSA